MATTLVLRGAIEPGEIPSLCESVRALIDRADGGPIVCDVAAVTEPDACTVDALARMQLVARTLGGRIVLRAAGEDLEELLELVGLAGALPDGAESGLEPTGQTEQREQMRRVEEEGDAGDAIA
jgi:ABC-type transporter Mla MlaB component